MIKIYLRYIFGLVFVVLLHWCNNAIAQINPYEIDIITPNRIIYEPFSGLPGVEKLAVKLVLNNAARENEPDIAIQNNGRLFQLRFRSQDNTELVASSIGLSELPVSLEPAARRRGFSKNDNEYIQDFSINGRRLNQLEFGFTVFVNESIYADAGIYTLPIVVELVDVVTDRVLIERLVELEVLVDIQLQANIAGADTRSVDRIRVPVIDFGTLKRGDSRRVSLHVKANTPAKIMIKSENKGRLLHEEQNGLYVDYSVNVDGEASTLESPLIITRDIAKTIEGSAYPMDVIIGDITSSFAGSYRDVITVEVRPL